MFSKWKAVNDLSGSARFSIRKQRGASLLLFPAAYTSVQNLQHDSHTVSCFFSTFEIASLSLFLPFLTCLILDLFSMFNIKQDSRETNMVRSAHQKLSSQYAQINVWISEENNILQHVRSGCLFYSCKGVTTT